MKAICQSCAMPMKFDPQGGGTNADGTKTEKYCSYCYANGRFKVECSVKEFQEHCRKKMIESGINPILAWLYSRGYRRLERWKK